MTSIIAERNRPYRSWSPQPRFRPVLRTTPSIKSHGFEGPLRHDDCCFVIGMVNSLRRPLGFLPLFVVGLNACSGAPFASSMRPEDAGADLPPMADGSGLSG